MKCKQELEYAFFIGGQELERTFQIQVNIHKIQMKDLKRI